MNKIIPSIYIAFGANLSNPKKNFVDGLKRLAGKGATPLSVSGLWRSPSWPPGQGHPDYLNGVARLHYEGAASALLELLLDVETALGRSRSVPNAPRTLDLDLLDFRGEVRSSPQLTLPHPRMHERGFVLFPLQQIAPDWIHPVTGVHIDRLTAHLPLADVAPMTYKGAFWPDDAAHAASQEGPIL